MQRNKEKQKKSNKKEFKRKRSMWRKKLKKSNKRQIKRKRSV